MQTVCGMVGSCIIVYSQTTPLATPCAAAGSVVSEHAWQDGHTIDRSDVRVLDQATRPRSSALLIKEALHMCLRPTEEKITRDLGLNTECILASFPGEEWRSFRVTSAVTATEELRTTCFARLTIFAMELCHKDIQS